MTQTILTLAAQIVAAWKDSTPGSTTHKQYQLAEALLKAVEILKQINEAHAEGHGFHRAIAAVNSHEFLADLGKEMP